MTPKRWIWLLLTVPALILISIYTMDRVSYGQALSYSGLISAWLAIVTLLASPLRLKFPALLKYRRAIGVAMFGYAALHVLIYLIRKWDVAMSDAFHVDLATGWIALILFAPLAITSTQGWVRQLGRRWSALHRLTYIACSLVAAHWLLTAFDPTQALFFTGALGALLLVRAYKRYRSPSHPKTPSP